MDFIALLSYVVIGILTISATLSGGVPEGWSFTKPFFIVLGILCIIFGFLISCKRVRERLNL